MKISKHEKAVKAAAKKAQAALNELIPMLITRRINALFCMTTTAAGEPAYDVAQRCVFMQRATCLSLALEEAGEKYNKAVQAYHADEIEASEAFAARDAFGTTLTSTARKLVSQFDTAIQHLTHAEKNLQILLNNSDSEPFWVKLHYAYDGVLGALAFTPDVAPDAVVGFIKSYRDFVDAFASMSVKEEPA